MMWSGVFPANIDVMWPHVAPLLAEALTRSPDYFTVPFVVDNLKAGKMQLWVVHDEVPNVHLAVHLALITEIVGYQGGKFCRLQLLGGHRLREAWPLFNVVIAWAKEQGADSFTCYPRRGLGRLLKKYEFQYVKSTDQGDLFVKLLESNARVQ